MSVSALWVLWIIKASGSFRALQILLKIHFSCFRLSAIPTLHSPSFWSSVGKMRLWSWATVPLEPLEMLPGTNWSIFETKACSSDFHFWETNGLESSKKYSQISYKQFNIDILFWGKLLQWGMLWFDTQSRFFQG